MFRSLTAASETRSRCACVNEGGPACSAEGRPLCETRIDRARWEALRRHLQGTRAGGDVAVFGQILLADACVARSTGIAKLGVFVVLTSALEIHTLFSLFFYIGIVNNSRVL